MQRGKKFGLTLKIFLRKRSHVFYFDSGPRHQPFNIMAGSIGSAKKSSVLPSAGANMSPGGRHGFQNFSDHVGKMIFDDFFKLLFEPIQVNILSYNVGENSPAFHSMLSTFHKTMLPDKIQKFSNIEPVCEYPLDVFQQEQSLVNQLLEAPSTRFFETLSLSFPMLC